MNGFKTLMKPKPSKNSDVAVPATGPSFYLSEKEYPEIKNCKLGETYIFKSRMSMKEESSGIGGKNSASGRFEITEVSSDDTTVKKTKPDQKTEAPTDETTQ